MENKKYRIFKVFASIFFAIIVFGAYGYHIWKGEPFTSAYGDHFLCYGAIIACFLFSLLFVGKSSKKVLITLALATNVAADYFLVFAKEQELLIGVCIFCGAQFFYMLYSLSLEKGYGRKIINLATRVALCLVAYFILPKYFTLQLYEMISVLYILNSFVTLLSLLFHIKTEWLTFLGFLLFFACDIFVGLQCGAVEIIGLTGALAELVANYDIAFCLYIPGIFLISLSSVWAKKAK